MRRFGDSLCLLYQTFNSLSRDHELKDSHIFVRSASRNSLSTPSLGITERRGPSPKSLCLNSNFQLPLSGSLPTFTKTSSAFLVSFNSLSRDHMFDKILDFILASPLRLSTPSLGITVPAEMMNPPGSIILSTPSLGITKFKVKHNIVFSYMTFQLPLSGSPEDGSDESSCSKNSSRLSTPSLGITWGQGSIPWWESRPFNSLSRDHKLCKKLSTDAGHDPFNSLSRDHR